MDFAAARESFRGQFFQDGAKRIFVHARSTVADFDRVRRHAGAASDIQLASIFASRVQDPVFERIFNKRLKTEEWDRQRL